MIENTAKVITCIEQLQENSKKDYFWYKHELQMNVEKNRVNVHLILHQCTAHVHFIQKDLEDLKD